MSIPVISSYLKNFPKLSFLLKTLSLVVLLIPRAFPVGSKRAELVPKWNALNTKILVALEYLAREFA